MRKTNPSALTHAVEEALKPFKKARKGIEECKGMAASLDTELSSIDPTDHEVVKRCSVKFAQRDLLPIHKAKLERQLGPLAETLANETQKAFDSLRRQKEREDVELLDEAENLLEAVLYPRVEHPHHGELRPARQFAGECPFVRNELPEWNGMEHFHIHGGDSIRDNNPEAFDKNVVERAECVLAVLAALEKRGGTFRTLPPFKKWLQERLSKAA